MSTRVIRRTVLSFAVVAIVASFWIEATRAETAAGTSQRVVEVPLHELAEIRQELKYLRERDAERLVGILSLLDSLPAQPHWLRNR